jgi:hypothetical protein
MTPDWPDIEIAGVRAGVFQPDRSCLDTTEAAAATAQ